MEASLATLVTLLLSSYAQPSQACRYQGTVATIIPDSDITVRTTAENPLYCIRKVCNCQHRCVASFEAASGQCLAGQMNIGLLRLSARPIPNMVANRSWITYMTSSSDLNPPAASILWVMDAEMKGRGLGLLANRMPNASISNIAWNSVGPLGASSQLTNFSNLTASSIFLIKPTTGILTLNRTGFTLSIWVKTILTGTPVPIFEFQTAGYYKHHFWFNPSGGHNQLYLSVIGAAIFSTGINSTGREYWRHVAVAYAEGNARFYVNGTEWSSTKYGGGVNPVDFDSLYLGQRPGDARIFQGSMACASVFQKALSKEEIAAVMESCP